MKNAKNFDRRWFMIDLAREKTFSKDEFTVLLDTLEKLGYNGIGVYLEGAFEFKNLGGVTREKVMTRDDAKWLNAECKKRGIYAFPLTNIAAHMNHFYGVEKYRDLFLAETPYQIDFHKEKARDFVMTYVRDYIEAFDTDMINIGGDEVSLKDENDKIAYAKFVGSVCDELLKTGIKPAIWGDMLFKNPELCDYINKDAIIFDWCYHGHSPDSLKLFKDKGFKEIFACNSDNGWIGLINHQHGPLVREDMSIERDEVEAFLEDAKNLGIKNAMVTDWENFIGRNLWGQFAPIARCALFLNGETEARECTDEQIDTALFGRITGYAKVTRLLRDGLHPEDMPRPTPPADLLFSLRTALCEPSFFVKVVKQLNEEKPTYFDSYDEVIEKAESILDKWDAVSPLEERCLLAMYNITSMARVASCMVKISKGYLALYKKASKIQFDSPKLALQYLNRFENIVRHCAQEYRSHLKILTTATADSGYGTFDQIKIELMIKRINNMADYIACFEQDIDRVALPRIERVLTRCIVDGIEG